MAEQQDRPPRRIFRSRWTLQSLLTFGQKPLWHTRCIDWHRFPGQIVHYYGTKVGFLPFANGTGGRHLTADDLEPYRQVGDPELDQLLEGLDTAGYTLNQGDDLLDRTTYPAEVQKQIDSFVSLYKSLPDWVDREQLRRGQLVFCRYAASMGLSLYYRSLCAGFSIPKIAQVIQQTGYLSPPSSPESVAFRLIDTGAMVTACVKDAESILPGNAGWKACLHVRILHAKVRRRILEGDWDTANLGVPINQEDMAATLLAFSVNTLFGTEMIAGVALSRQEQEDYIALWRYLGWLLGVQVENGQWQQQQQDERPPRFLRPIDPCGPGWIPERSDSIDHAISMLESIVLHLLHPDRLSVTISHHLLRMGRPERFRSREELQAAREYVRKRFHLRALLCRFMIGDPLADALELPLQTTRRKRFKTAAMAYVIMWCFRIVTWVSFLPWAGEYITGWYEKHMNKFFSLWQERHPARMASVLGVKSCCPFAMAMKEKDDA